MIDSFMGKLTLQDGTIVGAVLNLSEDTLTVAAEGMTVGTWPLKYCRVSRLSDSEFILTIDGEPTTFLPVDAFRFAKVAADRFSASPLSERINVIRNMPLEPEVVIVPPPRRSEPISVDQPARPPSSSPRVPLAIAALVVAVAGLIALGGYRTLEPATAPEIPLVRDTATVTVTNSGPVVFTLTPERFRELWNDTAEGLQVDVALTGPFGDEDFDERISELVGFTGFVASDGTFQGLKVDMVPIRDTEETRRSIGAIEVAIATSNPTMGEARRQSLIRELGFPRYPENYTLGPGPRSATVDGIRYELRFVDMQGDRSDLVLFSLWEAADPE